MKIASLALSCLLLAGIAHADPPECSVRVKGIGMRALESNYLPRVIACENGPAGQYALEAQAIAARTFAYHTIREDGVIEDSQAAQVYTCNTEPQPKHYAAVDATRGIIMTYEYAAIAAFYVAGAIPSQSSCIATDQDDDPTDTEHRVTYNKGRSGYEIFQSSIGWVSWSNSANRGCMSQNGARCLEDAGKRTGAILSFYYGDDIGYESAAYCPSQANRAIGDACSGHSQCFGDRHCRGGVHWPGGMCSRDCDRLCPDRDGAPTTFCISTVSNNGICTARCDWDLYPETGCRAQYVCRKYRRHNQRSVQRNVCVPQSKADQGKAPDAEGDLPNPEDMSGGCNAGHGSAPIGLAMLLALLAWLSRNPF